MWILTLFYYPRNGTVNSIRLNFTRLIMMHQINKHIWSCISSINAQSVSMSHSLWLINHESMSHSLWVIDLFNYFLNFKTHWITCIFPIGFFSVFSMMHHYLTVSFYCFSLFLKFLIFINFSAGLSYNRRVLSQNFL